MTAAYSYIVDLAKETQPPADGILSCTHYSDERVKAIAFGFAQSEELSKHTAPVPAILHFVQGEATLTLGDDTVEARAGSWVQMPADLVTV